MIEVRHIIKNYDKRTILDDMALNIHHGEKTIIYGRNGSGKSTLARIIAGLEVPDGGEIIIDDEKINFETGKPPNRKIGLMLQNPSDSILTTEVIRELAFPLEFIGLDIELIREKIELISRQFRLTDVLHRSPEELSGGMKARLALAATVITDPDYIILDEPTSYLDHEGRKVFFESLNAMKDKGIIFITQNPAYSNWADRILYIENGQIAPGKIPDSFNEPLEFENNESRTLLRARDIFFSYGVNEVIKGVDIEIKSSSVTGLLGRSGSGKSTLLNILAGLYKADSGQLESDVMAGMIFQFPGMQLFDKTVLDDVAYGPKNFKMEKPYEKAREALELIGLKPELFDKNPFLLSEGEKRRTGIAGVIASNPSILILDEPTATLDTEGIRRLKEIISSFCSIGNSIIIVSHDLEFIHNISNRVIVMEDGKVVFNDKTDLLFDNKDHFEKWGIGFKCDI